MNYFIVDTQIVNGFDSKRVICKVKNSLEFHCSFMSSKDVGHFVYLSKKNLKELHLNAGHIINCIFIKENSKY